MPTGTTFTLTADRKLKMMEMLKSQWTVSGIAVSYGISYKTLIKLFKKHGIKHKEIRMSGLMSLRSDTFAAITAIAEPDKKVKAGLDFLKQYPIDDNDDVVPKSNGSDKKLNASIQAKILLELSDD